MNVYCMETVSFTTSFTIYLAFIYNHCSGEKAACTIWECVFLLYENFMLVYVDSLIRLIFKVRRCFILLCIQVQNRILICHLKPLRCTEEFTIVSVFSLDTLIVLSYFRIVQIFEIPVRDRIKINLLLKSYDATFLVHSCHNIIIGCYELVSAAISREYLNK